MGFKVIVFLGMFIGMVLLISSQVGAARVLAHTSNTVEAYSVDRFPFKGFIPIRPKPKIPVIRPRPPKPNKPICKRNRYGKCQIPNLPSPPPPAIKKIPCQYTKSCKRGPPPRPT